MVEGLYTLSRRSGVACSSDVSMEHGNYSLVPQGGKYNGEEC